MRGVATAHRTIEADYEDWTAEDVLSYMLERHHPRLALACSFQKEEAVLIDMLLRLEPRARVFTIDTGALFEETYQAWRALEARYGVQVEVFDARSLDGEPWSPGRCCAERKVAALDAALDGLDAWITGLRREQAPTRASVEKISFDTGRDVWKANPLADWSEQAVWDYLTRHDVPYNSLHDRGYASIGCTPCTLPGSGREGRWAGSEKTECGIHIDV
ncbi:MAG: phosphoadenylyl-sulfate reductase [Solirubrobacteraceae bacterium]|jgi:phosphoadenosine phosphosulfate reductase